MKQLGCTSQPYLVKVCVVGVLILVACQSENKTPSSASIETINLKRGPIVLCGAEEDQFGTVNFTTSCSEKVKKEFNLAVSLLHSFEYEEAEKAFANIIDQQPGCALAYWGVAMSNYHQLWPAPPTESELAKGAKAIEVARTITQTSEQESAYIEAIAVFYKDFRTVDHHTRCLNLEKAMEKLHTDYPADQEAAIFYALALDAAADPSDKTYRNQRKAGAILTGLYPNVPNHPGIVHYLIHTYDSPELATLALPAARKYAAIAPASAHAQHMPSHIFTRLGLWDDCIASNQASTSSAKCYAERAAIKGHWDEELHGMDYLVYAYLQKGENTVAKQQCDYLKSIHQVSPINFKDAYAFAAIPARYVLENKRWKEAATLELHPVDFPWENFPWQKAIHHFTRLMGYVHTSRLDSAQAELNTLKALHARIVSQNDPYKANQVLIQIKSAQAWIKFKEGNPTEALRLMGEAATMEDNTQKSPVTPGEIIPARELMGDLLLQLNKADQALGAYEVDLKNHPNRFNGLYGAALAAERSHNVAKATIYYRQLSRIAPSTSSSRPESTRARLFLVKQTQ